MAIHLLTGDDESLLRGATNDLVDRLLDGGDRSMMVDEFDDEEYQLGAVVDAAQTPPFLTDRRVVVARGVGRFGDDDVGRLLAYVDDPLETTELVLTGGGGRLPKRLSAAVRKAGTVVDTAPPRRARDRQGWVADRIAAAGVRMEPGAARRLAEWLGEDAGRLDGVLATLRSAYGPDQVLSEADVEPFRGAAGDVPPWDLTDALDRGDTNLALTVLGRMLHAGERHPLQVMAVLHGHYGSLARLDGAEARSESAAAEATGLKGFRAKKALETYRRLGGPAVKRGMELLAQADLDLRGARDLDEELVMQILVARLSKLRR
jgi:DNA polymerase-3 subunit delta